MDNSDDDVTDVEFEEVKEEWKLKILRIEKNRL